EPFTAVKNAIEHYRVDDILISTLKGQQSKWLEDGLVEKVKAITDKPVEHIECSGRRAPAKATAAAGWSAPPFPPRTPRSTTARRRRTRARGSTARRSGSCSSSSPRRCCSGRSSPPTSSSASSPTPVPGLPTG